MVFDYDYILRLSPALYVLEKLVLIRDLGLEILYNGSVDLWTDGDLEWLCPDVGGDMGDAPSVQVVTTC